MYFKTQKFLVAGISRSGVSAAEFLLARGASVFLYDDVTGGAVEKSERALEQKGARILGPEDLSAAVRDADVLVLSPGIPIDHELAIAFKKAGKRIIGESELGCLFLRAPMIAVTGTNGKTTTVTMISEILKAAGEKAIACGNIGLPLCSVVEELGYDGLAVAEISSFQLETLSSVQPHVAVVTNISEDHLNRHYNMENYIFLKRKLLRNMRESEVAVLNFDDATVRGFADSAKCKVKYFSCNERVDGAYLFEGGLYFEGEKVMEASELSLRGRHNLQNALAAVCAARIAGVESRIIRETLASLKGIRHRIEFVREVNGVTYVNDSKGTNVDASVVAIDSMQSDTVLLLGGKDKGYDYDKLFAKIRDSRVVHAVLYGENRFKLLNGAVKNNYSQITLCADFEIAVKIASMTAKRGQCVLLSPASSSFDRFSNYEERGEKFEEIVKSLESENVDNQICNASAKTCGIEE